MVAKKTATKKPLKKTATKVVRKKAASKKVAPMRSFRVYKNDEAFTTFRITRQTVYWVILLLFIIATQVWIIKVQLDVANLTALLQNQ